ncbi:MAG TPA: L-threonylcarbamoyladenylate synthase [Candidatus Pacearchaeota archaeon]|nr:L-threonylcarbamoyladenylate synthase [Candidatus Pacearchaeota archaeon]HOL90187.1 L-threonylcarbamoyladenylate synthase [Candidatus Pacearchaeota archaeon]HPO68288.1 L-threonylcarbamoyladenylate synthase [Candidatus Pacearchaeota archaeon]
MEILKLNEDNFEKLIEKLAKAIKEGKVLICPTDTVYGLICDATNEKSVKKIFKIKKRRKEKAISVFVKDLRMAKKYAFINKEQEEFIKNNLNKKNTFILKRKKSNLLKILFGKEKTIGIRIIDNKLINLLLDKTRKPLTATSANISQKPASTEIKKVLKQFEKQKIKPDIVIDSGNLSKSRPSQIIDLTKEKIIIKKR